jgi:hypothetical protein
MRHGVGDDLCLVVLACTDLDARPDAEVVVLAAPGPQSHQANLEIVVDVTTFVAEQTHTSIYLIEK